ncbi:hypothetical protein JCM8097_002370 [Rhodosporidiobolus ruineniae]
MHISSALFTLSALATASVAAPLTARAADPLPRCNLDFNHTVTTQIYRSDQDTSAAWVPVNNVGQAVAVNFNAPSAVEVHNISSINSPQYWDIVPVESGVQKVRAHNYPSLCASGSGSGNDSSLVNFVDCNDDYALWSITCLSCDTYSGLNCQFSPLHRASNATDPSTTNLCATPPADKQPGALGLETCTELVPPIDPLQVFYVLDLNRPQSPPPPHPQGDQGSFDPGTNSTSSQ